VIINTIRLEIFGKLVKNPVLTLQTLRVIMIKSPRGESRGAKKITKNFKKVLTNGICCDIIIKLSRGEGDQHLEN
jgi:hypothetical protein